MQPEIPAESDSELIARAHQGDQDAFGSLYERYLISIYRYIYFRVADVHEAEDLTEMVFIKAWEALPGLRLDKFKFHAWLYRIAHNLVIDRFRTSHPNTSIENLPQVHMDGHNPEETFDQSEETRVLARLIAELDPLFQEVLVCRFILGYSHAETAEIMDKSIVYIRVLQHRALLKLKDKLAKELDGNDGTRFTNSSGLPE